MLTPVTVPMNVNCKANLLLNNGKWTANRIFHSSDYFTLFAYILPGLLALALLGCVISCMIMMWYYCLVEMVDQRNDEKKLFFFSVVDEIL